MRYVSRITMLLLCATICSCASDKPPRHVPTSTTRPYAVSFNLSGVRNVGRVSPILYRGGQPTKEGFDTLKSMGVKTIIDLRGRIHIDDLGRSGMAAVHIPANIEKPDVEQIVTFLRVVRDASKGPFFVHDDLGADRVGLFVAAYRMVEEDWSADDAAAELANFHFDVYWISVPKFLHHLDVNAMREELRRKPATRPTTAP